MKLLKIIILILVVVEIIFIGIYIGSKKKPTPVPTITNPAVTIGYSPAPRLSMRVMPGADQKLGSYAKGLKQFNKMDYDKAIVSFKEVTEKNPKNVWAHYYLFLSYVQIEENAWSTSSKAYKETTVIMSMKPDEEIRKSIENYLEDVKLRAHAGTSPTSSPTDSAAFVSPTPARTTSTPPAIGSPAIPTVSSKDADIHYDRGRDYDRKGNYNFAVAEYSNTIKINPKHIEAYISRGSLYETKSELGNAAADYSRAIELRPGDAKNYYRRGKLYKTMNDNEKAKADLLKVKELDPAMADKVDLLLKEMETPKE